MNNNDNFRSCTINKQSGFTLTELMLAMVLFSTVLVISTIGFIGMNRTFNRGVIKKQLSEGVQMTSEDISRTLRAQPANRPPTVCSENEGGDECPVVEGWHTMTFATVCYLWPAAEDVGGLFKRSGSCADDNKKEEVLDTKYRVRELKISPINMGSDSALYNVSGVFTTMSSEAIHFPSEEDPAWRCKGTAEHPDVVTCAVETFSVIISPQGGAV